MVNFEIEAFCEMYLPFQIWPSPKTYPEFFSVHMIPFLPRIQHNQKTLRLTKKLLDKPFLSSFLGSGRPLNDSLTNAHWATLTSNFPLGCR